MGHSRGQSRLMRLTEGSSPYSSINSSSERERCSGQSPPCRYCEEKFVQKYIPTIGVDYGVKPVKLGDYEVGGKKMTEIRAGRTDFGLFTFHSIIACIKCPSLVPHFSPRS